MLRSRYHVPKIAPLFALRRMSDYRRIEKKWAERLKSARPSQAKGAPVEAGSSKGSTPKSMKAELKAAQRRTRMNKTLISIEELKQIALSEIHTFPGCEDVSAVGIYPVTDEVVESNWSVQVVSGEGVDPKPQTALRFTLSTSFVTRLTG